MSKGVILLVSPSFPPMEGGVAMATYEMARDLQCLGWDIHVLTPESGLPPDSSLPDPCSVTRISFVSSHETRHRIDACLEHIHPSLVIFHSWQDWHLDYMAALCRERNIPMIIRSHGCHTDFHSFFRIQYPPFFGIKKWITSFPTIRRNVNKITGHLHLVCLDDHGSLFKGYDYYYAKKRGMPNFTVIPNTFLPLQPSSFSFRKKYHLEHSLLFSCPASASVRKNQKAFIRHVKKSNIKGIQFIFLVPQYKSYAEQKEKEADGDPAYRFFYGLPRHEVQAAIIESNAVFLYSIQEQQPLTLLEAMSCGVPWIAPDVGGISTLQGGIVLKKRNTRNLQQALLQMTQENTRKILSLAGKQFWCHRYSPKVVYQQWEILFNDLLKKNRVSTCSRSESADIHSPFKT
ncbi:MAG: glycosyltransferase family 4 protein [Akkermansia sp.]|uniref:glycosyltransferase family 4 protein n=1 Tax=Akkermansia sp. TaxID=1872421 RepID=UPI00257BB6D1|nr:glycosyltransferase family 4 protein [Akkermansia sp.]MBS7152968.1 glycosyltransferase family 4 protein [Akkermansia sp.]